MAYTFKELKKKTVAELREIAAGIDHEAVRGYTQLDKERLLVALCKALNIDMHEHHTAVGINKTAIKAQIKRLKQRRDEAIAASDKAQLKVIRRKIHRLKRVLRRAAV
jgi:hypothetical protein